MHFSSIFIIILFFMELCTPQAKAVEGPLPIVVSIAPQKWIIEQIASPNNVSVTVMVRPGSDAHSYEPIPSQMKNSSEAKVYFTIGLPFETVWASRIANAAKGLSLCSMIEGLKLQKNIEQEGMEEHSHSHNDLDPHVWLSPSMVIKMIPIVLKELTQQMPEKAALFAHNATTFQKELERIDSSMKKQFSQIDQEKRVFLTFHPAWSYFAREYGLKELSIEIEGKEPSPKALKKIIDLAKKYDLTALFSEPQFSRAAVDTLAESIHAKVFVVDPLGENIMDTWEYMTDILITSLKEKNDDKFSSSSSSCH